jgi:hypothetical protein
MTIRFAPAHQLSGLFGPQLGVQLGAQVRGRAANDNSNPGHSAELRAALKHFAEYGLGAANVARRNAEAAFFRGDRQGYGHWLGICRTLDRRMAGALAAKVAPQND